MNKDKLLILLLVAVVMLSCGVKPKFEVQGHLEDMTADSLLVMVINVDYMGAEYIDTIPMQNGKFSFNLNEKEMRRVTLTPLPSEGKKIFEEGYANFYYMPGEYATLSGKIDDMRVTGTGFYAELEAAQKSLPAGIEPYKALNKECEGRLAKGEDRDKVTAYLKDQIAVISSATAKVAKVYIADHPDSDVSALFVALLGDDYNEGIALLTDRAKEGPASSLYKAVVAQKEAENKRLEASKKVQPGMNAPDFKLLDLNGQALTLSSLHGKFVVIDFWGSWCGWCIKEFPEMKKYYAKYKSKVEFLGVACGDSEEKWKASVVKHELPWLHVLNGKGEKDVSALYAVQGYPTKIIIDPKGKIAKVTVGEDPTFYTYLDELFK